MASLAAQRSESCPRNAGCCARPRGPGVGLGSSQRRPARGDHRERAGADEMLSGQSTKTRLEMELDSFDARSVAIVVVCKTDRLTYEKCQVSGTDPRSPVRCRPSACPRRTASVVSPHPAPRGLNSQIWWRGRVDES